MSTASLPRATAPPRSLSATAWTRWIVNVTDPAPPRAAVVNDALPHDMDWRVVAPGAVTLVYPTGTRWMPTMPLDLPAVQLALEFPVAVDRIRVEGAGPEGARVWASLLDRTELHDDGVFHDLGRATGAEAVFNLPEDLRGRALSVLRLRAEDGDGRELTVRFESGGGR